MKVIIQIPCWNEEQTLPQTLAELPRILPGVDEVEWLVIDDGCTDRTAVVARTLGVDHIVCHNTNRGLAAAFQTGLNACLQLGADIIVNTDADNQYPAQYIPALIAPIFDGVDIVIGDRQISQIEHFSPTKKLLQMIGNSTVHFVSNSDVPDAVSGFRAFSREAALRLNVLTGYTYTLETIVQASKKNLLVRYVLITTNPETRRSRLIRSNADFVLRSAITLLRLFLMYEPLRTFTYLSLPFLTVGMVLWGRFLLILLLGESARGAHVQSLIVGSVALILAFLIFLIGMLGDVMAMNRRLQEESLYYLKRSVLAQKSLTDENSRLTER